MMMTLTRKRFVAQCMAFPDALQFDLQDEDEEMTEADRKFIADDDEEDEDDVQSTRKLSKKEKKERRKERKRLRGMQRYLPLNLPRDSFSESA